jgi:hypothetical protein
MKEGGTVLWSRVWVVISLGFEGFDPYKDVVSIKTHSDVDPLLFEHC